MESSELRALLSLEGLRLLDSLPEWHSGTDVVRTVADLRKAGHPAELVTAVLAQARLRSRARAKFGDFADRMLFTEAGLEQATRLPVAARHAGRFQQAGLRWIADLGCGIGADAMALAAYNLAPWSNARVEHGIAEDTDLSGVDGVFLDPARRDGARRLADPADWSPSLTFGFDLARRLPVGMKLGPGIDRDLIPADAEAQWISVDREVVEVGLWFGPLARDGVRRAALVIGSHGAAELTAAADSPDVPVGDLGHYLYEPDGAVIRARLIGDLARSLSGRMIAPSIAYVTSDALHPTPFATVFRVVESFPLDVKTLKRELATRGIGTLEIKKRGVDIDPAAFRTSLNPRGDASATLVLTRVGGARRALLVERVGA